MDKEGWLERFTFGVFREYVPGSVLINIGQAWSPHRVTVIMDGSVDKDGWSKRLYFYAWEHHRPGTVMVAVGEARDPWRCKLVLGRHINSNADPGWVEKFVFWAYYY